MSQATAWCDGSRVDEWMVACVVAGWLSPTPVSAFGIFRVCACSRQSGLGSSAPVLSLRPFLSLHSFLSLCPFLSLHPLLLQRSFPLPRPFLPLRPFLSLRPAVTAFLGPHACVLCVGASMLPAARPGTGAAWHYPPPYSQHHHPGAQPNLQRPWREGSFPPSKSVKTLAPAHFDAHLRAPPPPYTCTPYTRIDQWHARVCARRACAYAA